MGPIQYIKQKRREDEEESRRPKKTQLEDVHVGHQIAYDFWKKTSKLSPDSAELICYIRDVHNHEEYSVRRMLWTLLDYGWITVDGGWKISSVIDPKKVTR